MKSRSFLTAVAAGLACAQALAAAPPVKAVAADPWPKVPALPMACYSSQDKWLEQNSAAIDVVYQDHERQKAINTAIEKKLSEAMQANPMAMAQAMQQAMMKDPQNAQKYMQQIAQKGAQAQTELPAKLAQEQKLEAESKTLMGQYKAALDKALAPSKARYDALGKKLERLGFSLDGEGNVPPWATQEYNAIFKDKDQAYAANCATWWSATGSIQSYMKRYKDFLVQERIPYEKKLIDEPALENYKMLSVPTTGWRTTTDYDAARDYMRMVSGLFEKRQPDPLCRAETSCK